MTATEPPVRVLLAKLGLDGHDRGIKVVARLLRDAGVEVVLLGLRQTTDSIVRAAEEEDVDVIGISMHNAGHMTLAPRMIAAIHAAGLETPLVLGGIIPAADVPELERVGVAGILGPGASADEVVGVVRRAARRRTNPIPTPT